MRLVFRPIDLWPGELTAQREGHNFKAGWSDTLDLLDREASMLGASEVVVQVAADERAMRLDGGLRADAKPDHPGVIVSFESRHGPLRYWTDRFERAASWQKLSGWQANVRAIALGLEALRKIDRYGIANAGEQYRGWSALPPATPLGPAAMTVAQALGLIWRHADFGATPTIEALTEAQFEAAYRRAARKLHPDQGGETAEFQRLQEARRVVETADGWSR